MCGWKLMNFFIFLGIASFFSVCLHDSKFPASKLGYNRVSISFWLFSQFFGRWRFLRFRTFTLVTRVKLGFQIIFKAEFSSFSSLETSYIQLIFKEIKRAEFSWFSRQNNVLNSVDFQGNKTSQIQLIFLGKITYLIRLIF